MARPDVLEPLVEPIAEPVAATPQDAATPGKLACSWVIDATSGRPVCGWSIETWRPPVAAGRPATG